LLNVQCETCIKIRNVHIFDTRNDIKKKEKEIGDRRSKAASGVVRGGGWGFNPPLGLKKNCYYNVFL